jgi:WD40-like Beta Propeller Repeat
VQLVRNSGVMPFESPDGRYLYFSRNGRLWQVATDGAGELQVQGMPPMTNDDAWSSFSSGIYFVAEVNGKGEIDFFDLNTRSVRTIHVLDGPPPGLMGGLPVSPDGRWLLFAQMDELSSDLMMVENWR